jgi:hypothetical protein
LRADTIRDFQANRPRERKPMGLDEEEYFDFVAFSKDFNTYRTRNGLNWKAIENITGLSNTTLQMFDRGYQCSLRTLCKLADIADLSLDKYHRREFK